MSSLNLKRLLKKLNIKLVFLETDSNGYLVRSGKQNFLFVKNSLSEEETEKVILHEIGHLLNDDMNAASYSTDYVARLCCESGANGFLIREKVKEYVELGNDAGNTNYINLADNLGVKDYLFVKQELQKYLSKP